MKRLQIERSVSRTSYDVAHWLLRKPQSPALVSPETHEPDSATCAKRITGLALSSLASFLAQWTTLTILGLIGLTDLYNGLFPSFTLKILIASALALVFCILALPLALPWFILSSLFYFLTPRESVLRQWWVCTPLGVAGGVLAVCLFGLCIGYVDFNEHASVANGLDPGRCHWRGSLFDCVARRKFPR
jgi:hypothetical protein